MNQRGFTLLEVLVATTIMAIAVVGLLSAVSTSMRNASRLTGYDRVVLLARTKMDELMVNQHLPHRGALEGAFDENSGWRAQLTIYELPPVPGPGIAALDRIALEVWWMSGGQRRTMVLESLKRINLRPEDVGL